MPYNRILSNCFHETILYFRTDEEDMDPLVTPQTLSATMKVDSAFVSSLLPVMQCNLSASLLQLRLVNHLSCLGKGMILYRMNIRTLRFVTSVQAGFYYEVVGVVQECYMGYKLDKMRTPSAKWGRACWRFFLL